MNATNLSPRLEEVAQKIINQCPQPIRLADIGSDHAYLPCYLGLKGHLQFAVAGEVVDGPYQSALKEVENNLLQDLISVRKGDGLAVLTKEDAINAISICGMGGVLIRDILSAHEDLIDKATLVLQPNMASEQLRKYLLDKGFTIIDEVVIEDNRRYYEIIVAKKTEETSTYSDSQLIFGAHNLQVSSPAFCKKWQQELDQAKKLLATLSQQVAQDHPKRVQLEDKIKKIEEVLWKN